MKTVLLAFVVPWLLFPFLVTATQSIPSTDTNSGNLSWAGCGITKKAFMTELASAYEKKTGIKIILRGGGATKGIRLAAKGEIDIGGACRTTIDGDPAERDAHQIPVAWDALTVIVHKDNPASNITFNQIKALYRGKIKNWQQLGGPNKPVELYVRRGKISGVGRTLREIVFGNYDQEFIGKYVMKSSGPVEKGVQDNINGIGITGISSAKRRDVKILKLEGHAPTYENIKKGDYLLYRTLYLVTRGTKSDQRVKDFITFALSPRGQEVIRKAGTVPYTGAMGLLLKQMEQYVRAGQNGPYLLESQKR